MFTNTWTKCYSIIHVLAVIWFTLEVSFDASVKRSRMVKGDNLIEFPVFSKSLYVQMV